MQSDNELQYFDSHVHWLGTGQKLIFLDLSPLTNPEDLKKLSPTEENFQGGWLLGFGWDQNRWSQKIMPHRKKLDVIFPDFPVAFSRADGHALWLNTKALQRIGLIDFDGQALPLVHQQIPGGQILIENHSPTGVLLDLAMDLASKHIPQPDLDNTKSYLLKGQELFLKEGFTKIRDLSCNALQWQASYELDQTDSLKIDIEQFFDAINPADFPVAIKLAQNARGLATKKIQVKGIKIYMDGALGSEGAWISQPYCDDPQRGQGLRLLTDDQFLSIAEKTWLEGFELAVHAIGDKAVDTVVTLADQVWQKGIDGLLNIEHAQIVRPETIENMKGKSIHIHMQPCHYLSDKVWLKDKLPQLHEYAFPIQALKQAEIPIYYGSDSPIEKPSWQSTQKALKELYERSK
jgi:predicted amidohydrolase YtcJ